MATYTRTNTAIPGGADWRDVTQWTVLFKSATLVRLLNSDNTVTEITGVGFLFTGNEPTAGTITSVKRLTTTGGSQLEHVTGLPSLSLVTVRANIATAETIILAGDDTVIGGTQADDMRGGGGDDNVRGLAGNDTLDGGVSFDLVRYDRDAAAGGAAGVTVNLATGTATDGFGNTDTLSNFEAVFGTNQADSLTGDGANNHLTGLGGADTLTGGLGDDEVRYDRDAGEGGAAGVTVNLATGTATDGFGQIDTLVSIERVRGTALADTLTGNGADNQFRGLAGNDTIAGGLGFDEVRYDSDAANGGLNGVTVNLTTGVATDGFGNTDSLTSIEIVRGTALADTFIGRSGSFARWRGLAGDDTITGAAGHGDEVAYDFDVDNGGVLGVTVDLQAGTATDGFGDTDTLLGIERVIGTDSIDTLIGTDDERFNRLRGLAGNDTLDGGGGSGDEVAYDRDARTGGTAGVVVNLATGIATDGFGDTDTLIGIELARGTAQADSFIGSTADNRFEGGASDDTLNGGTGFDEATYENDRQEGGAAGVTVNLATGTATDGFGDTDTLISIEGVRGTEFADSFTGNTSSNFFRGLAGDDTINGGAGVDEVRYDRDHLYGATAGAVINLTTGIATDTFGDTDTLILIENVSGSRFADTITGSAAANRLRGSAGNDTINGAGGIDTVAYDTDALIGGRDGITTTGVVVNLTAGTATDGFGNTDTLTAIENVLGTGFADNLIGSAVANLLEGGAGNNSANGGIGNDTVDGGAGNDMLNGGTGDDVLRGATEVDTAGYGTATSGVTVNLSLVTAQAVGGGQGTDTLTFIENLIGSVHGDTLTGSSAANNLNGGSGGDTLDGGIANDVLIGGLGNDSLVGGTGNDNLQGGDGVDTLIGGIGGDLMIGGTGGDRFRFAANAELGLGVFRDRINDFAQGQDIIDLAGVDANVNTGANDAFTYIDTAAFSGAAGELRRFVSLGRTYLEGDTNGDSVRDFQIELIGSIALVGGDFLL